MPAAARPGERGGTAVTSAVGRGPGGQ